MKPREIYQRAALLMELGQVDDPEQGSCCAISQVMYPRMNRWQAHSRACQTSLIKDYSSLFAPSAIERGDFGESYWGNEWPEKERAACRVLALCFMAAIASGKRKQSSR